MGLLVIGSVAYDDIETKFEKRSNLLGGAATFISLSASYFTAPIYLVGVVGGDFKLEHIKLLESYNINLDGLKIVKEGKTFHWSGRYAEDFNNRETLSTELNVFKDFDPVPPEKAKNCKFVVLGNIDPDLQLKVLSLLNNPSYVILDTMNFWIESKRESLLNAIAKTNLLIINDSEARMLAEESNLIKAAKKILNFGVDSLIIKKGEHGALLFSKSLIFSAPAYPLEDISDPTGAGDSFAGGLAGYLHKTQDFSFDNLKKAVIYGSCMASFCVEKFSVEGILDLSNIEIRRRYEEFINISKVDE